MRDITVQKAGIDNADILMVYDNLLRGSRNHLRAFMKMLDPAGRRLCAAVHQPGGVRCHRELGRRNRTLKLPSSTPMSEPTNAYRDLTQTVSTGLSSLRASTPEVMKSFSDLGRAATAPGVLDAKTKELIAMALSVAARCDPCIGFHAKALVKLRATRQELDEALGVTTYMGGGPSLMYAAYAIAAFDEFAQAALA